MSSYINHLFRQCEQMQRAMAQRKTTRTLTLNRTTKTRHSA